MSRWMAAATMLVALAAAGAAQAADKIVLQLHGPAQFEFAGYFAALWQGFYRDAGLSVEIKPGGAIADASIDPKREVTEGRAQFGTGTADLVVRAGQGLPLLLLAPVFQESGVAVYSRADAELPSPAALATARVGRAPASNILDIELVTALKAEGIDPDKLRSVPLDPGQSVAALADRRVDAITGSAWDIPWRARERSLALKSFNPGDYRVGFYGDTLFTVRRIAEREPETVRRFRAASLKGWEYALQHADEVAARIVSDLPHPPGIADPAGFSHYQADLARHLAHHPEIALGHSNPDRWARIEASMTAAGALLRTADPDDFIYDPDAAARGRTDLRAFAILGATLLAGAAVMAWLWLRGRLPAPVALPSTMPLAAEPSQPEPAPASGTADLNAVLSQIERTIRRRVPRRLAFRLSLLPELWRCRADPSEVRRLVLDLVAGALPDLGGGGELIVGSRNYAFDAARVADTPGAMLGDYVRITVRDNGKGLSEEALDRVFDPGLTSRPSAAVAAAAVRAIGGFARVESAEGVGTAVHLYFPRFAEAAEKPAAAAE